MFTQTTYPVIDLAGTGRRIELRRRQAGLTVREIQAYFGFEYPQAIYKWQHGECLPTVDNLLALASLLQVSMEDLLVYEDREVSHFSGMLPPFRPMHPPAAAVSAFRGRRPDAAAIRFEKRPGATDVRLPLPDRFTASKAEHVHSPGRGTAYSRVRLHPRA